MQEKEMREKNRKTKIEFLKMAYVDNMKQSVTHVSTTQDKKKKIVKTTKYSFYPLIQISLKSKQTQILLSKMIGNNLLFILG